MHRMLRWVWTAVLGLASFACDSESSSENRTDVLQGRWLSACSPWQSDNGLQEYLGSEQQQLEFLPGQRLVRRRYLSKGENCQDLVFSLIYTGRYELGATWQSYAYELDLWQDELQLTALDTSARQLAEELLLCGQSDWSEDLRFNTSAPLNRFCLGAQNVPSYEKYEAVKKDDILRLHSIESSDDHDDVLFQRDSF